MRTFGGWPAWVRRCATSALIARDAAKLVDRIVTRDVGKCRIGQVMYTPWCDEQGKVVMPVTIESIVADFEANAV